MKVSVVMPVWNGAGTIERAVQSALSQEPTGEVVIVNDGSEDETGQVCAGLAESDPRVRYLRQEHGGTSTARNRGLRAARHDFVGFLDSDDVWLSGKLDAQLAVFRSDGDTVGVQTSIHLRDEGAEGGPLRMDCKPGVLGLADALGFVGMPAFSTVIARREVALRVGFNPAYRVLEDWDFLVRLAAAGTVRGVPEPLVVYFRSRVGTRRPDLAAYEAAVAAVYREAERTGGFGLGLTARDLREARARGCYMLAGTSKQAGKPLSVLRWLAESLRLHPPTCAHLLLAATSKHRKSASS